MGAKGIKRRKPYRRLPPVRLPSENDLIPPHIMWPDTQSGFEAHTWSPAGRSHELMRFVGGLRRGRGRPLVAVFVLAVLALLAFSLLGYLVSML